MNNNKKQPGKSPIKNPFIILLLISIAATILLNFIVSMISNPSKTVISYSEFMTMVQEDKVDEVIIQSERYTTYEKPQKSADSEEAKKTIDRLQVLSVRI